MEKIALKASEMNLVFGGKDETKDVYAGYGRARQLTHRYIRAFGADFPSGADILIPASAGEKELKYKTKIRLVNPYAVPATRRIDSNNALVDWTIHVDDVIPF